MSNRTNRTRQIDIHAQLSTPGPEPDVGAQLIVPPVPNTVGARLIAPPYLEVKGLQKTFGLKPILRNVNLNLQHGERIALLGANGAGKTTLLRILAGLTKPSAGTATINGLDIVQDVQQIRRLIGFVGHQPYLYEEMTAWENLLFFSRMYTVKLAKQRVLVLLQRVGLEKRMHERVSTLSRGQVQRLALARAMMHSPQLLLLDEPDTGLDTQGLELIETLLAEHVAQGGAALFTTHQHERAAQWSDRMLLVDKGRVTEYHALS